MSRLYASGIYRIRLIADGRCYVGSSATIEMRWRGHLSHLRHNKHHSPYLQNAWNKYGADAFAWEVVEECAVDDLVSREQFWIDSTSPVFNLCQIAGSTRGHKHTPEARAKISAAGVGRKLSADGIARISAAHKGKTWSPEQRAQIAAGVRAFYGDICRHGHELTEDNVYWRKEASGNLGRQCRECGRIAWRKWNAKKTALSKAA